MELESVSPAEWGSYDYSKLKNYGIPSFMSLCVCVSLTKCGFVLVLLNIVDAKLSRCGLEKAKVLLCSSFCTHPDKTIQEEGGAQQFVCFRNQTIQMFSLLWQSRSKAYQGTRE